MAGADDFCAELFHGFKGLDPLGDVAVCRVVVGAVHARVAGEKDLFIRQPSPAVAVRVRDAEVEEFHAVFAVVKNHLAAVEQRRRFEFARGDIGARLRGVLPASGFVAEDAGLIFFHLLDHADVRDGRRAIFHPHLVPVRVVAVVVRVECKADRLAGDRLDLRDDFLRAGGEVAINDEHVILEDDPAVVAMPVRLEVALVKIDFRGEFGDLVHLRRASERGNERECKNGKETGGLGGCHDARALHGLRGGSMMKLRATRGFP